MSPRRAAQTSRVPRVAPRPSRAPRWRRRARAGLASALVLVLAWWALPLALRHVAWFRVRQIELVGVRNLSPDAVIAALRLEPEANVFADTRLLADRVRGLPGVAAVRVLRHLPAALTVDVREVEPAALMIRPASRPSDPGDAAPPRPRRARLIAVDALGHALPFDPARSGLDLPIARGDSSVAAVLALIQSVDPALFQAIGGARGSGRGDVVLELGAHRVVVGRDAGPEVIRAVALVAQDLAARGRRYVELDARFAGQVVVRQHASAARDGEGGA